MFDIIYILFILMILSFFDAFVEFLCPINCSVWACGSRHIRIKGVEGKHPGPALTQPTTNYDIPYIYGCQPYVWSHPSLFVG